MNLTKRFRSGFTLIELLTVIAIIAVLAALLFPVFSRVRESTHQATCFTNMHDLQRAAKLYKEDNNHYPASLLGFAEFYDASNKAQFYLGGGTPMKVNDLVYKPLFHGGKYLRDVTSFTCPDATEKDVTLPPVTATYPLSVGAAIAGMTVVYYNPIIEHSVTSDSSITYPNGINANIYFYPFDSYDTGPKLNMDGTAVPGSHELHYSLDWTGGAGSADPRNQLKYGQNAPEDTTVLTWCTEHVANGSSDKVLVLMLSGKTIPVDAKLFATKGPLNFAQ